MIRLSAYRSPKPFARHVNAPPRRCGGDRSEHIWKPNRLSSVQAALKRSLGKKKRKKNRNAAKLGIGLASFYFSVSKLQQKPAMSLKPEYFCFERYRNVHLGAVISSKAHVSPPLLSYSEIAAL